MGADGAAVFGQGRGCGSHGRRQPSLRGGRARIGRTGAPWRDLPPRFGKWNTVFKRFRRWTKKGVFKRMFEELSWDMDFGEVQIDGTNVRVHQHATGREGGAEKSGRSRGGLTTKMVALVDAWGRLLRFSLLAGHRHESLAVRDLLSDLTFGALLADGGFDSDRLRGSLAERGAEAVIPPNASRNEAIDCDMEKYRRRHRVENFFCRIKHFRHIAIRYDQTESSYAAMIFAIAALLVLA